MKGAGMLFENLGWNPWRRLMWGWPNHFWPLREVWLHESSKWYGKKIHNFLYFFPAKYNGALSHKCTPQSERTSIPAPFIWERKKMGRNVNWHPEKKYTWILWGNLKKKRNENWHKLYDVYLPLVRLCTSMNSRNDIFGQRMPGVDIVYYMPCYTCFITWNQEPIIDGLLLETPYCRWALGKSWVWTDSNIGSRFSLRLWPP